MKKDKKKKQKNIYRTGGILLGTAALVCVAAGGIFITSGESDALYKYSSSDHTPNSMYMYDVDADGQGESAATEYVSGTRVTEVSDGSEVVDLINETWDADYEAEADKQDDASASAETDTSKYQLKRLMVLTDGEDLSCSYGATDILHYEEYDEYVLQFETEADTAYAYYQLAEEYGAENCVLDEVVTGALLSSTPDVTADTTLSWGGSYMGFGYLKAEYEYYAIDEDVTVALIDTGVDTTNSIFKNRIDTKHSFNFWGSEKVSVGTQYKDYNGHGTHVAGIIADSTPDNVSLMVLKTFDASGKSSNLAIRSALQYAVSKKVDVVNMSFGWTGKDWRNSTFLSDVLAQAELAGTIVCCAAGNDRLDVYQTYPANCENVITVSAINKNGIFAAAYSNYGDTVDFAAPGSAIRSTSLNGTYSEMNGTSFSTPFIASAVAYVKMIEPDSDYKDVVSRLKEYAVDKGSFGWDPLYGWGTVDLHDYFDNAGLKLSQKGIEQQTGLVTPQITDIANQKDGVKIEWSKSSKAKSYVIYRKTGSGNWKKLAAVSAGSTRSYTDSTVKAGKKYTYRVRAKRGSTYGSYSQTKSIRRLTRPQITVNSKSYGCIIKWQTVTGAKSYRIYRKTGNGSYRLVGTTTRLYYKDKSVSNGVTYSYKIRAVNGSSVSSISNKKTIKK